MSLVKTGFRYILTVCLIGLVSLGVHDYLQNFDPNECSMTYMMQSPNLIPINLRPEISQNYSNYKLFLYCEGEQCSRNENIDFRTPGAIPVLFVTGNADSHLQVRSIASVALAKSFKSQQNRFLFFTISFNEELNAIYGPLLKLQTEYTRHCIEHILKLFKRMPEFERPKSVLMIGNSMGGVISRGVLTPFDENDKFPEKKLVHTIITQSTPHIRPVIAIDSALDDYYNKVNQYWLNRSSTLLENVVLVSTYGGTRDLLVRSGLANINKWNSKSPATIISVYTGSIPYVWRSVDHRCMSWCKELILVVNRALWDMIDPTTSQLIEDKTQREKILKFRFVKDAIYESSSKSVLYSKTIEVINDKQKINYEFNGFNKENKLVVFNLDHLISERDHDSLFIYSNFEKKSSFFFCKDLTTSLKSNDEHECTEPKDLFEHYGRSIPPQNSDISVLNINDLQNLVLDQKYTHLVAVIPVKQNLPNKRELFVKFDWYFRRDRVKVLDMPNLFNREITFETKPGVVFQRYYLAALQNVLEAFILKKDGYNECDDYLMSLVTSKSVQNDSKPLSSSNLIIEFYEPTSPDQTRFHSEHMYHSQLTHSKSKSTMQLKLSSNQRLVQHTIPYLDLIQIDVKHLVHHKVDLSDHKQKCSAGHELKVELDFNSMLGQFVRFFLILTPAFIVAIIQFYDYLLIRSKNQPSSFFVLSWPQTFFGSHIIFSLFLCILCFVSQTNSLRYLIELVDPQRVIVPVNDFEKLNEEGIHNNLLPIFLYLVGFGIISVTSTFLTAIVYLLSILIKKILLKIFFFLNYPVMHKLLNFILLAITVCSGIFSSALANVFLFYGEMVKLATVQFDNLGLYLQQTRLLLVYLILVLNLPSVIVWVKSVDVKANINEIQPLHALKGDNGITVAAINTILFLVHYLKRNSEYLKKNILNVSSSVLSKLIMLNCILTVLYSTVSLFRLQYFILIHLCLMCLFSQSSLVVLTKSAQKSKNE